MSAHVHDVAAGLERVRARIAAAARRAGRDPATILLVAATKGVEPARIDAAAAAGLTAVGENRVQELERKRPLVRADLRWDFIGSVQRNKARRLAGAVTLIHGATDLEIIAAIGRAAAERGTTQEILIEVNTSGERTKHGCAPADALALVTATMDVGGVSLRGLMTMAAPGDPDAARRSFARLRAIADEIAPGLDGPVELSMGMSDDLEIAVEEGATIVRVGSAIFGPRTGLPPSEPQVT